MTKVRSLTNYTWAPGRLQTRTKGSAQTIGAYLEAFGKITVDELLHDAQNRRSPLHPLITWNDEKAAVRWRRQEAREIVNHLIDAKTGAPAFFSIRAGKKRAYVHGSQVSEKDIDQKARKELHSWVKRYRNFRPLRVLTNEVSHALTPIQMATKRLARTA